MWVTIVLAGLRTASSCWYRDKIIISHDQLLSLGWCAGGRCGPLPQPRGWPTLFLVLSGLVGWVALAAIAFHDLHVRLLEAVSVATLLVVRWAWSHSWGGAGAGDDSRLGPGWGWREGLTTRGLLQWSRAATGCLVQRNDNFPIKACGTAITVLWVPVTVERASWRKDR